MIILTAVKAYLDLSDMTYAIQAMAGIVIATGAVADIYWRKARKRWMISLELMKMQYLH